MKIAKNISLGIGMQVLVLLMHILIHFMDDMNGSFGDIQDIQIACSFAAAILITYLAVLCFDLPVYAIFCGAVITFLFVLIFENEGVYLLYYLHRGSSQFFNPDVFTDAVIIVLEMLVVQLPSFALAKLTRLVCKKQN
ncbi:MAG: hypothetical protein J6L61_07795 [Ruminiclostridium sp.]|nr:hypothetical protein [Ruminiclostridium sp.]